MISSFQIPSLSRAIPQKIVPLSGRRRAARLARSMLAAGFITGEVSARRAADPVSTCQHYLQAWLNEQLGSLKCLQPGFRLSMGEDRCLSFGQPGRTEDAAGIVWLDCAED